MHCTYDRFLLFRVPAFNSHFQLIEHTNCFGAPASNLLLNTTLRLPWVESGQQRVVPASSLCPGFRRFHDFGAPPQLGFSATSAVRRSSAFNIHSILVCPCQSSPFHLNTILLTSSSAAALPEPPLAAFASCVLGLRHVDSGPSPQLGFLRSCILPCAAIDE